MKNKSCCLDSLLAYKSIQQNQTHLLLPQIFVSCFNITKIGHLGTRTTRDFTCVCAMREWKCTLRVLLGVAFAGLSQGAPAKLQLTIAGLNDSTSRCGTQQNICQSIYRLLTQLCGRFSTTCWVKCLCKKSVAMHAANTPTCRSRYVVGETRNFIFTSENNNESLDTPAHLFARGFLAKSRRSLKCWQFLLKSWNELFIFEQFVQKCPGSPYNRLLSVSGNFEIALNCC